MRTSLAEQNPDIVAADEMKAFIEAKMPAEGYASASESLRNLIRDAQKRWAKQELEVFRPLVARQTFLSHSPAPSSSGTASPSPRCWRSVEAVATQAHVE
jgi:Arc/MetJ-type ribon-helix-helix transcriptional regulator